MAETKQATTTDEMQAAASSLSVVIPAYNEENGIKEIALRVLSIKPAKDGKRYWVNWGI